MMKSYSILIFLCLSACVLATSDPATGHHYLGKKPLNSWISTVSARHNSDIQATECSHNTRMSNQKFAWFQIDQHESIYGTCYATNEAPSESQLKDNSGYDEFFWQNSGGQSGVGTGPIRDPNNGDPGYEDNSGAFHTGNAPSDGSSTSGGSYKNSSGGSTKSGTSTSSGSGSDKSSTSSVSDTDTGTTSSRSITSGVGTGTTSSGSIKPGSHTGSGKTSSSHKYTQPTNPYGVGNRKRLVLYYV